MAEVNAGYVITNNIEVKLEGSRTFLYINGEKFIECMRLVLQIPLGKISDYDFVGSIDDLSENYKTFLEGEIYEGGGSHSISPEQEFWGHCSNIQAWVEHDYDSRLIHSNLAFPILRRLSQEGVKRAQVKYAEEVVKRVMLYNKNTFIYLCLEGHVHSIPDYLMEDIYISDSRKWNELLFKTIQDKDLMVRYSSIFLFDKLHSTIRKIKESICENYITVIENDTELCINLFSFLEIDKMINLDRLDIVKKYLEERKVIFNTKTNQA